MSKWEPSEKIIDEMVKEFRKKAEEHGFVEICPKHPTYNAIRKPKHCPKCWEIYRRKNVGRDER